MDLFDNDKDVFFKVTSGYSNNVRLEGGSCGYGDYPALDDFVSGMFVSKSANASNNLIIFCPEQVDSTKVFPVTEMLEAFSSSTYEYFNGIPKSQLKALYDSGNQEAVLQILSRQSGSQTVSCSGKGSVRRTSG